MADKKVVFYEDHGPNWAETSILPFAQQLITIASKRADQKDKVELESARIDAQKEIADKDRQATERMKMAEMLNTAKMQYKSDWMRMYTEASPEEKLGMKLSATEEQLSWVFGDPKDIIETRKLKDAIENGRWKEVWEMTEENLGHLSEDARMKWIEGQSRGKTIKGAERFKDWANVNIKDNNKDNKSWWNTDRESTSKEKRAKEDWEKIISGVNVAAKGVRSGIQGASSFLDKAGIDKEQAANLLNLAPLGMGSVSPLTSRYTDNPMIEALKVLATPTPEKPAPTRTLRIKADGTSEEK